MPMHPSNTYTIHELQENAADILHLIQTEANKQIKGAKMDIVSKLRDGAIWVEQGEIAGCAGGTFDNICAAADILRGRSCGNGAFSLSIYPGSMPALAENTTLMMNFAKSLNSSEINWEILHSKTSTHTLQALNTPQKAKRNTSTSKKAI